MSTKTVKIINHEEEVNWKIETEVTVSAAGAMNAVFDDYQKGNCAIEFVFRYEGGAHIFEVPPLRKKKWWQRG